MSKKKQWMAIISFPHPGGTKPHVLQDDEGDVATFASVKAIEKIMEQHALQAGVWAAFNFEDGQLEIIG